jgi:hypothetical protein
VIVGDLPFHVARRALRRRAPANAASYQTFPASQARDCRSAVGNNSACIATYTEKPGEHDRPHRRTYASHRVRYDDRLSAGGGCGSVTSLAAGQTVSANVVLETQRRRY